MPLTIFEALSLPGPTENPGAALRAEAARLNEQVVVGGTSLAAINFGTEDSIAERDRSLLRAMLTGSLRWHHRFEWQISRLLARPLKRRDTALAALLRIGLTQLEALRIPDHAAVSATVDATANLGLSRARGLVNAVLRRYLREREGLLEQAGRVDVARFSHPEWFISELKRDWPNDYESILDSNNALPPLWIRVNRIKIWRDDYLKLLERAAIPASDHSRCEDAVLLREPRPVHEIPGFSDGWFSVQDIAAQGVIDLLQLEPGLRVLDVCAAPGGKTAHMLERCPELGEVTAVEHDRHRLEMIRENLKRLGLDARLVCGDATEPDAWFDGELFDRILIDAPCSATGVIRRHPDIKVLRQASDIAGLAAKQGKILDAIWPLLKPGGLLVYATCSVLKAENLDVTQAFAGRNDEASLAPFGSDRHYQLLPGETNADGFYYACLHKGRSDSKYKVSAVDP